MNATDRIERVGTVTGRWPRYHLIVNGINLGLIRRTIDGGGDQLTPHVRYDGWRIHGEVLSTREEAEQALIRRARQFGHLKETSGAS